MSQNITVDAFNSPYALPSGYEVGIGDTMLLLPGAVVELGNEENLVVHGVFRALGNSNEPVIIRATNPAIGWGVLDIRNTSDSLVMQHTFIQEGRIAVDNSPVHLHEIHLTNNQQLLWSDVLIRIWYSDVQIQHSSFTGSNRGEGIFIQNASAPVIANCSFDRVPDAIELISCQGGMLRKNVFHDMNDDAIDLNHCEGILLDSNLIYNVGDRGMEIGSETFGSSTNITVTRNCFRNCFEAVNFKEGSSGNVTHNTFFNNTYAVATLSAPGFEQENVLVGNCIFDRNSINISEDTNALIQVTYSSFSSAPYWGEGNFSANPFLSNPEMNDFTLSELSPCIDMGNPNTSVDLDGSRADIGAWHKQVERSFEHGIHLWPNPAHSDIHVLLETKYKRLEVINHLGQTISSRNIEDASYLLIHSQKFSPGSYIFKFSSQEAAIAIPVVVL